ncbi:MAG: tetratricopeptide repeat protein [Planctomycetaceae bacterium]
MFRLIRKFRKSLKKEIKSWSNYLQYQYFSTVSAVIKWFRTTSDVAEATSKTGGISRGKVRFVSLINPLFWIKEFWVFLVRYLYSRNAVAVLLATPAVLGTALPGLVVYRWAPSPETLLNRARNGYSVAAQASDFETEDFYLRKLSSLEENPVALQLLMCGSYDRRGEPEKARSLAEEGYVKLQSLECLAWACRSYFAAFLKLPDAQALDPGNSERLEQLLQEFLRQQDRNTDMGMMLGAVYVRRGQPTAAADVLTKVVSDAPGRMPEAAYYLAICQQQNGRLVEAKTAAKTAIPSYRERLISQPFSMRNLVELCRCLIIDEKEQQAIQMMQEQSKRCQPAELPQIRFLMGDAYAAESRRMRQSGDLKPEDFLKSLDLLARGLAVAPLNPRLLDELSYLGCSTEVDENVLQQKLQQALDSGISPGFVHFIQGTRDLLRKPADLESAMQHLDAARQHNVTFPGLLNNLAWGMTQTPDGNMDQALELVEQALRMMPGEPVIYETRGQVLLRQQKYQQAIADFERSLASSDMRADAHEGLAKAWEQLGNAEKAAYHQSASQRLRAESGAKP